MSIAAKDRLTTETRERRWDASQYRERAQTLRELALRTKYSEVRRDLTALALRHERLAAYIEAHFDDGSAAPADEAD
jgi:hypothetical protein